MQIGLEIVGLIRIILASFFTGYDVVRKERNNTFYIFIVILNSIFTTFYLSTNNHCKALHMSNVSKTTNNHSLF